MPDPNIPTNDGRTPAIVDRIKLSKEAADQMFETMENPPPLTPHAIEAARKFASNGCKIVLEDKR